jgi:hypothetical protein
VQSELASASTSALTNSTGVFELTWIQICTREDIESGKSASEIELSRTKVKGSS